MAIWTTVNKNNITIDEPIPSKPNLQLASKLIAEVKKNKTEELNLGNCGLTELPEGLFELDWLKVLILTERYPVYNDSLNAWEIKISRKAGDKNNIKSISENIKNLKSLKVLVIGLIPSRKLALESIESLSSLVELERLDLECTKVSDLSPLENLKNLKELYLTNSEVNDLTHIAKLVNLNRLILSNTPVSDLSPIKNLLNLRMLNLSNTLITEVSELKNMSKLQILDITNTNVNDVSSLKNLMNLALTTSSNLIPNKKSKILMLTANPAGETEINLNKEFTNISEKLQDSKDKYDFIIKKSVNSNDFKEFTERITPDILHFSGHGIGGKFGGIVVQNDDNNGSELISSEALDALFEYFKDQFFCIQALILNACYSSEQAQVISKHVNYVIGTTVNINDKAAIAFSSGFYFKLAYSGLNFIEAFKSGRMDAILKGAKKSDFVIYNEGQILAI